MTRGNNMRPTRRLMAGRRGDEYVVELGLDVITIRPKRARRGGPAEVTVLPGQIYVRAMMAMINASKPSRRRRGRRASTR